MQDDTYNCSALEPKPNDGFANACLPRAEDYPIDGIEIFSKSGVLKLKPLLQWNLPGYFELALLNAETGRVAKNTGENPAGDPAYTFARSNRLENGGSNA